MKHARTYGVSDGVARFWFLGVGSDICLICVMQEGKGKWKQKKKKRKILKIGDKMMKTRIKQHTGHCM
jgi:hypothetical protein